MHGSTEYHAWSFSDSNAASPQQTHVLYQDELMQNWELVKDGKEPVPVPPMRKG